ncbi:major facilitator superfamily domain-containing protein [Xylaria digitata]|nr:major facilitator superfamily domain-containing protein [Xylaria digitata]
MPSRKSRGLEPAHDRVTGDAPDDDRPYDREATERASLLPQSDGCQSGQDRSDGEDQSSTRKAFTITIAISVLLMMAEFTNLIAMAPRMAIFEDIICRQYYADWQEVTSVADCKIEPVQSELARINGWKRTSTMVPGLALSIPYGFLADRIGRSKVLSLALFGVLLNETWTAIVCALPHIFPLRAVWLSGAFTIVGGGPATVVSMCYAIISDVCRPHQRTTAFSLIFAGFLVSDMISTPLGAAFIAVNPWIPVLSAIGIRLGFTLVTIGTTIKYGNKERLKNLPKSDQSSPTWSPSRQTNVRDRVSQVLADLGGATVWITKDIVLLLIAFFLSQINRESSDILLQYSSIKFHWDFAKASYLIALRAGINILVLFALIPGISSYFRRKGMPSSQVDKYITIASGTLLVFGSVLIFSSSTPTSLVFGQTVTALGFAFTVTARSFMTTLASTQYMGLLSISITIASHGAIAVGGPFLAWTFHAGLNLGNIWIGMPFLVEAILFALGTIAVVCASTGNE